MYENSIVKVILGVSVHVLVRYLSAVVLPRYSPYMDIGTVSLFVCYYCFVDSPLVRVDTVSYCLRNATICPNISVGTVPLCVGRASLRVSVLVPYGLCIDSFLRVGY